MDTRSLYALVLSFPESEPDRARLTSIVETGDGGQSRHFLMTGESCIGSYREIISDLLVSEVWHSAIVHPIVFVVGCISKADDMMRAVHCLREWFLPEALDIVVWVTNPTHSSRQKSQFISRLVKADVTAVCSEFEAVEHVVKKAKLALQVGTEESLRMRHTLYFYNKNEPWYVFTNFAAGYSFTDPESLELYLTTEHYFQANKVQDASERTEIRMAAFPRHALDIAKKAKSMNPFWDCQCQCGCVLKEQVMMRGLRLKFSRQFPKARYALLSTGRGHLVEDAPGDIYWGWGRDHTGANRLGALLKELREDIIDEEAGDFSRKGI